MQGQIVLPTYPGIPDFKRESQIFLVENSIHFNDVGYRKVHCLAEPQVEILQFNVCNTWNVLKLLECTETYHFKLLCICAAIMSHISDIVNPMAM